MKKTIIIIVTVVVIALIGWAIYFFVLNKNQSLIKHSDKSDIITVITPIKDSMISSPLSVSGRVRGSWFFEGSFPVVLIDSNGKTIAEGHASAQGDWMTGEFVKFIGNLQFNNLPSGEKGTLILKKDNASGLPENDDSYLIPILFK